MEVIFGIIIVVVLLLVLGVSLGFISILFSVIISMGILAMLAFFVFSAVRLMRSKKKTARFDGTEAFGESKFDCAVYLIEGERYKNAFPCEVIMRERIYKRDKDVTVRLYEKKNLVYDKNSAVTIGVGLASSLLLSAAALVFFFILQ